MKNSNNQRGFAAFFITILILAVVFAISVSIYTLTYGEQKISSNVVKSTQAYYASEAGVEDILLRLAKNKKWTSPYILNVGSGSTTIGVSNIIGGSRTINSSGNVSNRIRKIQVAYSISSDVISFHYGAQIGAGGMVMENNSEVQGNVFSNGTVTGGGKIDNNIIVAGNGNKIQGGLHVKGNATVHSCQNATVDGDLTYVSGGSVVNCTVGGATLIRPNQIDPVPLPILQSQIDDWKNEAAGGGICVPPLCDGSGNLNFSSVSAIAGPLKIPGNLNCTKNGAILTVTGTLWVVGGISFSNSCTMKLSSAYGANSGVVVADGIVDISNNVTFLGSGTPGSYIMILSAKNAPTSQVMDISNNSMGAIYYAGNGRIHFNNNATAQEVTAYGFDLDNNAIIMYEIGLSDVGFTSGPGGGWEVASWKEVE